MSDIPAGVDPASSQSPDSILSSFANGISSVAALEVLFTSAAQPGSASVSQPTGTNVDSNPSDVSAPDVGFSSKAESSAPDINVALSSTPNFDVVISSINTDSPSSNILPTFTASVPGSSINENIESSTESAPLLSSNLAVSTPVFTSLVSPTLAVLSESTGSFENFENQPTASIDFISTSPIATSSDSTPFYSALISAPSDPLVLSADTINIPALSSTPSLVSSSYITSSGIVDTFTSAAVSSLGDKSSLSSKPNGVVIVDLTSTLNIDVSSETATTSSFLLTTLLFSTFSSSTTASSLSSSTAASSSATSSDVETASSSSSADKAASAPPQKNSGLSSAGKTAIGVVIPVVVLALLGVGIFFLWKRHKKRNAINNEIRQQVEDYQFNPNILAGGTSGIAGAGAVIGSSFNDDKPDNDEGKEAPFTSLPMPPAPTHGFAINNGSYVDSKNDYNNSNLNSMVLTNTVAGASVASRPDDATSPSLSHNNSGESMFKAVSTDAVAPTGMVDHVNGGFNTPPMVSVSPPMPINGGGSIGSVSSKTTPIFESFSPHIPAQSPSRRGSGSAEASGGYRGWGVTSQAQTTNGIGSGMSPVPPITIHRQSNSVSSNSPVTNENNSSGMGLGLGLPVPSVPRKSHRRTTSQSISSIQSWEANSHKRNQSSINDDFIFQLQRSHVPTTPPSNGNSAFEEPQRFSNSGTMGLALDSPSKRSSSSMPSGTKPLPLAIQKNRPTTATAPSPRMI
ncbi:hypothetical protein NADFUDRAFT_47695 [Nadsonia fulvescens var. elongata DSM 6958]|uniref:Mid2 domain-containing protein n=1 Tax=Nadsonia fulvescens var. elongata DSM 6958 TaxID=857566 RepID=A0A1E3PG41_9ASCO|nr:hypothetical protein NADFUDRAFT_47695 [Nadsonia fulvescens var. elongata DSM 6958]